MLQFAGAATALTSAGLSAFLSATHTQAPDLWAVLAVETSGCGFLPDRRPKILFERHQFHALTRGRYDRSHPDISAPHAGGYGPGGASQYDRLARAVALDRASALKSTSWGIAQTMGLCHAEAGFADVETMVTAMARSEDAQLLAMAAYLNATHLAILLSRNDWIAFAQGYNGPDYAGHNYNGLLRQFHGRFKAGPLPNVTIRAVQVGLTYHGYDTHGIDGMAGPDTQAAIRRFQSAHGLPASGQVDALLLEALAR